MRFRVLPPAGGFASLTSIYGTVQRLDHHFGHGLAVRKLKVEIAKRYDVPEVSVFGSGKDALREVFSLVSKQFPAPVVAISAYTCPDVAIAAIRAGCRILPLEMKPDSLEPDPAALSAEQQASISVFILSNLYGLPDSLADWSEVASAKPALLIDDACQAFLSKRKGKPLGTSAGTVGILSFGRGKSICGVGGGGALFNHNCPLLHGRLSPNTVSPNTVLHNPEQLASVPEQSTAGKSLKHLLIGMAGWLGERPALYAFVSYLPGLHVGQTVCDLHWNSTAMSDGQALHALTQIAHESKIAQTYQSKSRVWASLLKDLDIVQPYIAQGYLDTADVVPIRYPVLFRNLQMRDAAFKALTKYGLGASTSYPHTLQGFSELRASLIPNTTPIATLVSSRILTLPVHQYVRPKDMERAADLIRQYSDS